jgi:hypothetical protein
MASTEYLALFAMYVFASYAVARRFVSPEAAFTLGLLCAVNAYMHFMSDQAAADLPFAVTTVAFLFFATARPGRTQEIIATAFCVAAYLFRTAGLALILAWICDALLKRRFRAAFIRLAVNFLPVAAWNRYIARVERSPEYARTAYSYQRADFYFTT